MTIEEQNRQKLREAVKDIDLTSDELHTLEWLAGWEAYSVDNIISVMNKARAKGQKGE